MKLSSFVGTFFWIFILGLGISRAEDDGPAPIVSPDGHKIVSLDVQNDTANLPVITFYVRYPQNSSPKDKVDGVFAYVGYLTDKNSLKDWIDRPSDQDFAFKFADQHQLAIVTWTTATMYSISDSFTTEASEENEPSDQMEQCFRAWERGIKCLCRNYSLPENGYLMYGFSRGAQWAHRIALRCPEKFLAIHIHVNSSFAEPTPEASHCLWLLTTGELEHGRDSAKAFYAKCLALDYPILLRIYPGKGHEVFPEEEQLDVVFFKYALKLRDAQIKLSAGQLDAAPSFAEVPPFVIDDSLLTGFQKPLYYGDMLNGDVYSADQMALVSESQRVGIPDLGIAKLWGYFHPQE